MPVINRGRSSKSQRVAKSPPLPPNSLSPTGPRAGNVGESRPLSAPTNKSPQPEPQELMGEGLSFQTAKLKLCFPQELTNETITSIAFHPKDRFLVCGSTDSSVKLWSLGPRAQWKRPREGFQRGRQ
jgi:WD40 repeat protein